MDENKELKEFFADLFGSGEMELLNIVDDNITEDEKINLIIKASEVKTND